jgi:hypothetical protein
MSDQDALTALLGARDWTAIEIDLLKCGIDIAQCFQEDGYTVGQRMRNFSSGLPPFVHAQGEKPWRVEKGRHAYLELSPYRYVALEYADALPEKDWMIVKTIGGQALDGLFLGDPNLAGIVPAIRRTWERQVGWVVGGALRVALKHAPFNEARDV